MAYRLHSAAIMSRSQSLLRTLRRVATGVLLFVLVVTGLVTVLTERRLARRYDIPIETLTLRDDEAQRARGEHLVRSLVNCVECHGDDLGGSVMLESAAIGTLAAPNLTPAGRGAVLQIEDWTRAITRGVGPDGHALLAMPSADYAGIGREDLAAIIAYVRSVPPVERRLPESRLGPVGRFMLAAGQLPILDVEKIDLARPLADAPEPARTAVFGEYLATGGGCRTCHGPDLAGGPIPGSPPGSKLSADLRPASLLRYSDDELRTMLRSGRRPDGSMLDSMMPWRATSRMTELELDALLTYLRKGPDQRHAALP